MIKRLGIYLNECFKPLGRLIFSLLLSCGITAALNLTYEKSFLFSYSTAIFSTFNIFLFFLYIRVNDEFKDYEIDKIYFPQRPVPSGRVTLKDLSVLRILIVSILIIINILFQKAFFEFAITFALFFLCGKDYFLHNLISGNRILIFLSHAPIYYFLILFSISMYTHLHNFTLFTTSNALIALWFLLPMLIFELARKTRTSQEDEDGYQSYSNLLGFRNCIFVLSLFVLLHQILLMVLLISWGIVPVFILSGLAAVFLIFICIYSAVADEKVIHLIQKTSYLFINYSYLVMVFASIVKRLRY
jgi:hypothetical protein